MTPRKENMKEKNDGGERVSHFCISFRGEVDRKNGHCRRLYVERLSEMLRLFLAVISGSKSKWRNALSLLRALVRPAVYYSDLEMDTMQ